MLSIGCAPLLSYLSDNYSSGSLSSLDRSRKIRRQHKMVQIPTAAKEVAVRQVVVQLEELMQLALAEARQRAITESLRWVRSQSRWCPDQLRLVTWSSTRRRTRRRAAVWCNNRTREQHKEEKEQQSSSNSNSESEQERER